MEIINKGNENEDIEHLFEYGKPVQFFSIEAEQTSSRHHYHSFSSSVSYVDGSRMVVTLPSSQALIDIQNTENLGVQLYFDETSYKSMFHALDDAINAKNNRS